MSKKVAETIEMSVTDARQGFLALVDRLTDEESIVCVTKHGRPTVAMLSWKAYERVQGNPRHCRGTERSRACRTDTAR